jgi:peptidoglycan/xylan/chitin deacetylase (PgdA/CDA1 family)
MKISKRLALGAFFIALTVGWLVYPGDGVPILAYHMVGNESEIYSVSDRQFEEQMAYLAENHYTAISLKEFFDAGLGQFNMPEKPIIITFDDGYEDNYSEALPIMEKYGMKATVFIITDLVGKTDYLSWQQIIDMINRHIEIGSHTMTHVALTGTNLAERQQEISQSKFILEEQLGIPVEFLAYPYGDFDNMTQEMVRSAGYRGACAGTVGIGVRGENDFALKRVNIPHPKYGLSEFKIRLMRANIYSKLGI